MFPGSPRRVPAPAARRDAPRPLQKAKKTIGKTTFCDMRNSTSQTLIKPVVSTSFWRTVRKKESKSLGNHYVYKRSVMHFRGVGNPSYSLGKHCVSHTVKYPIRIPINMLFLDESNVPFVKRYLNHWKIIMFISILWCTSEVLETLHIHWESIVFRIL